VKDKLLKTVDLVIGDTWPKRRLVVWAVLIFCAELVAVCLWAAVQTGDAVLIKSVSDNAFYLGGTVALSYVFGSIWDDNNKRKHLPKTEHPLASPAEGGE
jgi:hypothetical protein